MTNQEILYNSMLKTGHDKEVSIIMSWSSPEKYFPFIFSHKFSKLFFGEELIEAKDEGYFCLRCDLYNTPDVISWKYHLSKMILEENPLKYLEKFLEEK